MAGGESNNASGQYSFVGGGWVDIASGNWATVSGGRDDVASGEYATVPGGQSNTAGGAHSLAAGRRAKATNQGSFVWADSTDADFSSAANDEFAARAGGGVRLVVGSGALRIEPNATSPNLIGGFSGNSVGTGVYGATISGGGEAGYTCGWGSSNPCSNRVQALSGTVGGGVGNTASGRHGTVGGGNGNTASGNYATVGGGVLNTAGGNKATVPGGEGNSAIGENSFAAGTQAKANHNGSFVWGDFNLGDVTSTADNQFKARTSGGVYFYTKSDLSTGVYVAANGGAWNSVSDRALKENFTAVNGQALLDRLARVPITTWNYKGQDAAIRHIGPVAQDFYAAFGVGEDDKHISTLDPDGVALAAGQALYRLAQEQASQIAALQAENASLKAEVAGQRQVNADQDARLVALEARTGGTPAPLAGRWGFLGLAAAGLAVGLILTRRGGAR